MPLGPGIVIGGRYVIEKKIGEGSWGEVWLGHHVRVGMRVAVKALRASKVSSHDAVVRFGREAKLLGRIQSDYVARVLDYLDDDVHGLLLVMELVHGDSLEDVVAEGPLTAARAIEIGCDIAAGLCDLHEARIVHRDLKPANIILRPLPGGRTRAVIIDFSLGRLLARPGDSESSLTALTGAFMSVGTLPYMSPEQVLDSRKVTFASDVYALGALLYRCVSGSYVFIDVDDAVVAKRKLREEAPRLDADDETAAGLSRVVARALKRRPEERYPEAREMLAELLVLRDAARAHAHETPPATSHAAPPPFAGSDESTQQLASPAMDPATRPRARSVLTGVGLLVGGVVLGAAGSRALFGGDAPAAVTTAAAVAAPRPATAAQPVEEDALAVDDDASVDALAEEDAADSAALQADTVVAAHATTAAAAPVAPPTGTGVVASETPSVRPPPAAVVAIVTATATTAAAPATTATIAPRSSAASPPTPNPY